MKRIILCFLLSAFCSAAPAATFTEFFCNGTGTNVNAGSTTNATPTLSGTGGNWTNATQTYRFSGATDLSAITNGMWASVYPDGNTVAVYIGRITAVNDANDFITVSNNAATGIAPANGTGTRSIRIGGAWYGPYGAESFPLSFVNGQMTNTSLTTTRINIKGDHQYTISAGFTLQSNGPIVLKGWTNTVDDLGLAHIALTNVGAGALIGNVAVAAANWTIWQIEVSNNSATSGNTDGWNVSGADAVFYRCVVHDVRDDGFATVSSPFLAVECEVYNCGEDGAGIGFSTQQVGGGFVRCIAHDITGIGFQSNAGHVFIGCIADSNTSDGYNIGSQAAFAMIACDAYNNGGDGIEILGTGATDFHIESCNFIGNLGWGITNAASWFRHRSGLILNCGFGSGTMTNALGSMSPLEGVEVLGTINYANNVTPWVDPANGDFRINLAAAINAGRGGFIQTASSYSGTVGYPDIGAAQATNDASGGMVIVAAPLVRR